MIDRAQFLAGVGGALALADGGPAGAQALVPLHVTTGVTIGARSAVYAVQAGIFKKYGLDVDLNKAGAGAGSPLAALIGGSYQVDYVNTVSLVGAVEKGIPLRIIAPGAMYKSVTPYALMFVRKDSPIKSGRDLNGKTIASQSLKDINAISMLAWIDQNGGDAESVHAIELPNATIMAAIDDGRIEAGALVPPFQTAALASGKYRVIGKPYDGIGKRFQIAVWASTSDWVTKNPDIAKRFAAAMREASSYANANPAKVTDLIAAFTGLDPHIVATSPGPDDPAYLTRADIQPVIDACVRYGVASKPLNADELLTAAVREGV